MTTAYDSWETEHKLAYLCARQAYYIDDKIYPKKYRTFATNSLKRTAVHADGETCDYKSRQSEDQMGMWLNRATKTVFLGFRGTDLDPRRFLGRLPEDYGKKISDECTRLRVRFSSLPFSNVSKCLCSDDRCDLGISRETVIETVTNTYCDIGWAVGRYAVLGTVPDTIATRQMKSDDFELKGGNSRCSEYSDCYADIRVALKNLNGDRRSRFAHKDPKHDHARKAAIALSDAFTDWNFVCCGHSLGGSLAMAAFLELQMLEVPSRWYGFNSAPISNFDTQITKMGKWESVYDSALHVRMFDDGVSCPLGDTYYLSGIKTITYKNKDDSRTHQSRGINVDTTSHGLWPFKRCTTQIFAFTNFPESSHSTLSKSFTPSDSEWSGSASRRSESRSVTTAFTP